MDIGFERIDPTPSLPANVTIEKLAKRSWDSTANAVVEFKRHLKEILRKIQRARCCYCRRFLGDANDTHLEHVMEKALHSELRFEIKNIALSCSKCNTNKQQSCAKVWVRFARQEKARTPDKRGLRTSLVFASTAAVDVLPSSKYRWVHPHFHNYSEHMSLSVGWVFTPLTSQGRRTVRGLDLNALEAIERRKWEEEWESGNGRLSRLVGRIAEMDEEQAVRIGELVADAVRRRLAKGASDNGPQLPAGS